MPPVPNLFIVGAQKAGTTSLYEYLRQHPEVFMSDPKEPRYFNRIAQGREDEVDEDAYLGLFEDADGFAVRGEATTGYLHEPDVPELIQDFSPRARIVISLRDPIQRAYSNYWRKVAGAQEDDAFGDAIEREIQAMQRDEPRIGYLDRSLYADAVERYMDTFGEDRVHVLLLHEIRHDAEAVLEDLFSFLDIDPSPAASIDADKRQNTFRGIPYGGLAERVRTSSLVKRAARAVLPQGVRDWLGNDVLLDKTDKPPISEAAKHRLAGFFEEDIRRLETLLGRDLDPLRAAWPASETASPQPSTADMEA